MWIYIILLIVQAARSVKYQKKRQIHDDEEFLGGVRIRGAFKSARRVIKCKIFDAFSGSNPRKFLHNIEQSLDKHPGSL